MKFLRKKDYIIKKHCVLCNSKKLQKIYKLSRTPLANSYPKRNLDKENYFSLTIILCNDCGHLQLKEIVNPKLLFSNYLYVSGTSKVLKRHFETYAQSLIKRFKLKKEDGILDIACNDGTFLENFKKKNFSKVVGIEPAKNLKKFNLKKKIDIKVNFFSSKFSNLMKKNYNSFKIITANNVCAHTPHLIDFFLGVKNLLSRDGVFVFEVSYLIDVIKKLQFDTIYHEHMSYHSLSPLKKFFSFFDLEIIDFERVDAQGGSIRIYVCHKGELKVKRNKIDKQIKYEIKFGLFNKKLYKKFFSKILKQKIKLKKEIRKYNEKNYKIVGYGAPAKVTTFCHLLDIGKKDIKFIIDDNKLKQNYFTPGKKIPIKSFSYALKEKPKIIIVLAWNFFDSIVLKCKKNFNNKIIYVKAFPKIKKIK